MLNLNVPFPIAATSTWNLLWTNASPLRGQCPEATSAPQETDPREPWALPSLCCPSTSGTRRQEVNPPPLDGSPSPSRRQMGGLLPRQAHLSPPDLTWGPSHSKVARLGAGKTDPLSEFSSHVKAWCLLTQDRLGKGGGLWESAGKTSEGERECTRSFIYSFTHSFILCIIIAIQHHSSVASCPRSLFRSTLTSLTFYS